MNTDRNFERILAKLYASGNFKRIFEAWKISGYMNGFYSCLATDGVRRSRTGRSNEEEYMPVSMDDLEYLGIVIPQIGPEMGSYYASDLFGRLGAFLLVQHASNALGAE